MFESERPQHMRINIYDLRGKFVNSLADGDFPAGPHSFLWNGKDSAGTSVSSGTYVVQLETAGQVDSRKVSLVR